MNYTALAKELHELNQEDEDLHLRIKAIRNRKKQIEDALKVPNELDPATLAIAACIIYVIGDIEANYSVIDDAITEIAARDGEKFHKEFFGAKIYDRWYGQRCDCMYGYGPRHGSIILEIGFRKNYRGIKLNQAEREAVITVLSAIKEKKLSGEDLEIIYRENNKPLNK